MSIHPKCPKCGEQFERPDGLAGQLEKCPECRFVFRMPSLENHVHSETRVSVARSPDGSKVPARAREYPKNVENRVCLRCRRTEKQILNHIEKRDKALIHLRIVDEGDYDVPRRVVDAREGPRGVRGDEIEKSRVKDAAPA